MVTSNTFLGASAVLSGRRLFTELAAPKPERDVPGHPEACHTRKVRSKLGQEIRGSNVSGFVVTAGMTTKPDSSGGFAGQIEWEECAPHCAAFVRSPGAHTKAARLGAPWSIFM